MKGGSHRMEYGHSGPYEYTSHGNYGYGGHMRQDMYGYPDTGNYGYGANTQRVASSYQEPSGFSKHSAFTPGNNFGNGGGSAYQMDPVSNNALSGDLDITIRHAFVRKVFTLVCLQLLFTFGFATMAIFIPAFSLWLLLNYVPVLITTAIVSVVCMIALFCYPSIGRQFPINMILLCVLTLCFAFLIACVGSAVNTNIFFIAAGMTAAVTLALTLFAIQTKFDFTGAGPYLLAAIVVVLLLGIFAAIFRNTVLNIVYASIGALLMCVYIVFDVQLIVGGKHRKFQFDIDDYVLAAISLYLDIVNLFLYLLQLLQLTQN